MPPLMGKSESVELTFVCNVESDFDVKKPKLVKVGSWREKVSLSRRIGSNLGKGEVSSSAVSVNSIISGIDRSLFGPILR